MRTFVKRAIKRMPVAYVLLSKLYQALHYGLRRYRERLFDYRGRYWGAQTLEDIAGYWDTRNDPHKNALLLEVIAKYSPSSLLELGANCGNKLYCIAREYPNARLVGLDISQVAVDYGAMLVVVGTRNQGSVKRLVLGSVADDLVHDGHFPVLVAHANRLAELPKTEFPDEPMPEVDAEPHERPLGASVYRSSLISAWKSLGSPTSADFR